MPSRDGIAWEGILSEYQLLDPLNISERPDGSSVKVSFAGKHASEFLSATVQNGKLNGAAMIKDHLQRRVLDFGFVDGVISGPYKLYKNGLVVSEGTFANSRRNGEVSEYCNRKLLFHGFYTNDRRDGEAEEYDGTGFPIFKGMYRNGIRNTDPYFVTFNKIDYLCQFCSETNSFLRGQFNPSTRMFDGLCVEVDENNHPIRLLQYSSGKQLRLVKLFSESSVVEYDANGRVIYEGTYSNDPKQWYPRDGYGDEYYEGKLVYSGCFINGLRNGQGTAYYLDNHALYNGSWKEGRVNGSGVCICRDGSLFAKGEWNNGELHHDMELVSFDEAVKSDEEMCPVFSNVLSYLFKEETIPRSSCSQINKVEDMTIEEITPLTDLVLDEDNVCDVMTLNGVLDKHISRRRDLRVIELRKRNAKLESCRTVTNAISDESSSDEEVEGGLEVIQDHMSPEEVQRFLEMSAHHKQQSKHSVESANQEKVVVSAVPEIPPRSNDSHVSPPPPGDSMASHSHPSPGPISQPFNPSSCPNDSSKTISTPSFPLAIPLHPSPSPIPDVSYSFEDPSQPSSSSTKPSESPNEVNPQSLSHNTSEHQNSPNEPISQPYSSNDSEDSNNNSTLVWNDTNQLYYQGIHTSTGLQGQGQILTADKHILQDGIFAKGMLNGPGKEYFPFETISNEYALAGLSIPEEPVLHLTGIFVDGELEGEGKEYGIDGNLVYCGFFHEGVYDGEGTFYDNANEVMFCGIFKNGTINGKGKKMTFFEQVMEEGDYQNGLLNGKGVSYHATGQIEYEGEFEEGRRCGFGQMFDDQGRLVYQGEWYDGFWQGEGVYYDYDQNIQMEGEFVENQLNGVGCVRYLSDQELLFQGVFQDSILTRGYEYSPSTHMIVREGTYTMNHTRFIGKVYHENGSLWIESIFENDQPNGATKVYRENGTLEMEGGMRDGLYHGFCILYNPDGTKQIECEYENGNEEGEKTEFDHGFIRWSGIVKNGIREGIGCEYDPNGRVQFKGEYRGNIPFEGTEVKYMGVEKEQWCFCRSIHNGSYSSELLIYAIEDVSPRELDQTWQCVYQGGWIQESSFNDGNDEGEWILDGSDIPLRHGQGVLYLSDGRSVQTEWNRDLPDTQNCTVFTEKSGTKMRRSRYVGEILLEIFDSLLHPELVYHGKGVYYYEDNSFFMGIWDNGDLNDYQPFIYWSDNTVKYETQIIRMPLDGSYAHEFMPSKQTRYHPKNWNGYIEGMFSQEYNCIQNPVYYYDHLGHMICGPANAKYSMNPDGYNVDYGYPQV